MQQCLQEFKGSLLQPTLLSVTDQGVVGDPVWQEALVQHCLEEPQGSLQLFTLSAGTNQGIAH